jgi:hypothetical protein
MISREEIRAIRGVIAEAQHQLGGADSQEKQPSELLATAISLIDNLLSKSGSGLGEKRLSN